MHPPREVLAGCWHNKAGSITWITQLGRGCAPDPTFEEHLRFCKCERASRIELLLYHFPTHPQNFEKTNPKPPARPSGLSAKSIPKGDSPSHNTPEHTTVPRPALFPCLFRCPYFDGVELMPQSHLGNLRLRIANRQCVRAAKEMDSKSIGLCPQGFESPRCRFIDLLHGLAEKH